MDPRTFPTKGNLMLAKNSLALAKQGYDLMDKKRNILIRELMDLIDEARSIQEEIDTTFTYAYQCLQRANIENGISNVELLAYTVPIENSITIQTRSIMGTEIPHVKYVPDAGKPTYSFSTTHESIDKAREAFRKVKDLTVKLSMVENAQYQENTKARQRAPEYHDSHVLCPCLHDYQRAGRKGEGGVHKAEGHQEDEDEERIAFTYSSMASAVIFEHFTASTTVLSPVTTSPEAKIPFMAVSPFSIAIFPLFCYRFPFVHYFLHTFYAFFTPDR